MITVSLSEYLASPNPSSSDSNILLFQKDFNHSKKIKDIPLNFVECLSSNYKDDFIVSAKVRSPDRVFNEVINLQIQLKINVAHYIKASENNPGIFILPDSVCIATEKAGQGAESTVFRIDKISGKGSPITQSIVKISNRSYSKYSQFLENRLSPNSRKDPRIDHIQAHYSTDNPSIHLAICENSDSDLKSFNYENEPLPVKFIIKQLKEMAGGLALLHRKDVIHRDIKGANLLVNKRGRGKVTDLGLIRSNSGGQEHTTVCTPYYAAPFIWKNLADQLSRKGYQGKEADVFSFGRTIQYDVIVRIVDFLSKKHLINFLSLSENIAPLMCVEIDVQALEQNYPNQVILGEEGAYIFPERDELYNNTLKVIRLFKNCIPSSEFNRLNLLAELAFELQECIAEKLPDMMNVEQKLLNILKIDEDGIESNQNFDFDPMEKKPSSASFMKSKKLFSPIIVEKEPLNTKKRHLEESKPTVVRQPQDLQMNQNQLCLQQAQAQSNKKVKIDYKKM